MYIVKAKGLTKSKEEPNLHFPICNGKYTIFLLYVDDIIITSDGHSNINTLNAQFNSKYKMTYLGEAKLYLGVELLGTPDGIYFYQQSYIERLLLSDGMVGVPKRVVLSTIALNAGVSNKSIF